MLLLLLPQQRHGFYDRAHTINQHWQQIEAPRLRLWPKKFRALISSNAARMTHFHGATGQTMANPTVRHICMSNCGRASLALHAIIPENLMKGCFRTLALLLDARIHVNVNVLRIIKMTLFKHYFELNTYIVTYTYICTNNDNVIVGKYHHLHFHTL